MKTENELIADFMGWVHADDAYTDQYEMANLAYHYSWNKLMPVIDKIESLGLDHKVTIERTKCRITAGKKIFKVHTIVRINSAYQCIIQFIKWYNEAWGIKELKHP